MRRLWSILVSVVLFAVGATGTAAAASGDRIAFATWDSGVFVASADGGALSQVARNTRDLLQSTAGIDPSWSPDARRLVYASNHCVLPFCDVQTGVVRVANADGSAYRKVVALSKMRVSGTVWSPVDRRIAFVGRADAPWELGAVCWCGVQAGHAEIFVVNDDGTRLIPLAFGQRPAWSPDGRRLAFYGPDGGVYVVNATGVAPVIRRVSPPGFAGDPSLLGEYGWAGGPAWSPDGKRIAIVGNTATEPGAALGAFGRIYVVESDGSNAAAVGWSVRGGQPTWSPDGRQLAYLDSAGINTRAVGSGHARLLVANDTDTDWHSYPSWSPDGGSIAYAQYSRNGAWSIWRVTPGGETHRIVSAPSAVTPMLRWSPR